MADDFFLIFGAITAALLAVEVDPGIFMESIADNHRWKLRPDVVATVLNDGAVMLDLESKFFFSANSSAWAIAEMFESGATPAEVHEACARWGAVNGDKLLIDEVIGQMVAEGLVKPANGASVPARMGAAKTWIAPSLKKHREPLQRIMVSAFDPGLPLAE
jgi:hypothetical protein